MKRYYSKIQSLSKIPKKERPRICKNVVMVCDMAACIIVVQSFMDPGLFLEFSNLIMLWSDIMLKLIESDLKLDVNNKNLKEMIRTVIEVAPTASHLYAFNEIISEKVSRKCIIINKLKIFVILCMHSF